jgi:N-acetylated-alpha-linked acidic dipeptidase
MSGHRGQLRPKFTQRDTNLNLKLGIGIGRGLQSTALIAAFGFLFTAWTLLPAREKPEGPRVPLGFSPETFREQSRWEKRFLSLPDAARCRRYLRQLTREPHVAGTPGDRRVTEFIFEEFRRAGLNPEIVEYRVLLSYPLSVEVHLSAPEHVRLANPEPPIPGDPDTRVADPMARVPWNAYSPSADLDRPVVYVNYGRAEDYERLEKLGVSVKEKLVLLRYFRGYRGGKSLEAERRGAAGIILFSDPVEDGVVKGPVYPRGPWGPKGHFQRGAVVYDFLVPGDPLTPGWASVEGARRIPVSEARVLPKIPMVPLSAADAEEILKRLGGAEAPKDWQGGLPLRYRIGDDSARVRLRLEMQNAVTPIWNVIARMPGSDEPERLVILGNHHDAWVYGAVDPSSGTASMLELARAFGRLLREGFRPRRTIVLASWDAEEYTLTGSTEWGEQFSDSLRRNAVVCLNVDASTSGRDFAVSTVPSLLPALIEATQDVIDPATGKSVYDAWRARPRERTVRSYAVPGGAAEVPFGLLGGGSDYMVFLQHLGVPSLDMIFDGPYGVYHSVYDNFRWMDRFGDRGFHYHAAMARLWGLLALRFANADILPFDYALYAGELATYLEGLEKTASGEFFREELHPLIEKAREWKNAAATVSAHLEAWRKGGKGAAPELNPALRAKINTAQMAQERALLHDEGLPDRPWFRHLIYAPLPSYEAQTLPALRSALEAGDQELAKQEARRLLGALERAVRSLEGF